MSATVIAALIAAVSSIASALIAARSSYRADEAKAETAAYQRRRDEQEREREYVEVATAQSMLAVLDALDVSLLAIEGGHLNGNVEAARKSIARARDEYQTTRSKALFSGLRGD